MRGVHSNSLWFHWNLGPKSSRPGQEFLLTAVKFCLGHHSVPEVQHPGLHHTGNFSCRQIMDGSQGGVIKQGEFRGWGFLSPSFLLTGIP